MNPFWSEVVSQLAPYVPGEQPKVEGLIKLNTNENPYPPSPRVRVAIASALGEDGERLRLYPDPTSLAVREAAGRLHGLTPDHVFVGNGSDEVLAFVFCALLKHGGGLLFPDITYSFYPSYCKLFGISYRTFEINDAYEIDLHSIPRDASAIIFPNPNAPTGKALRREWIERFLTERPQTMVVIDEAYVDFGAQSCVPLIPHHPNLLVTQSLSKSRALAGIRVGLAFAQPSLLEAVIRVKDSFNSYPIDPLACAAAVAALEDTEWLEENRRKIEEDRDWLTGALQYYGFQVLPSLANFVFARHPKHDAGALAAGLRERKILVRHFQGERTRAWIRVTVGTRAQCEAMVDAVEALISKG